LNGSDIAFNESTLRDWQDFEVVLTPKDGTLAIDVGGSAEFSKILTSSTLPAAEPRDCSANWPSNNAQRVGPNWLNNRSRDLFELRRLAIYLQCGLGRQQGRLARKSLEDLPKLFDYASTFLARLDAADRSAVTGSG
jgi:hypothetical protein